MKQKIYRFSLAAVLATVLLALACTRKETPGPAPEPTPPAETAASVGPEALQPDSISNWVDGVYNTVFGLPRQQRDSFLIDALRRVYWEDTLPANGKLYHYLGYVLKSQGRYVESIQPYENAIRIHERLGRVSSTPGSALYKPLANVFTRLGENEKAEHLLRVALDSAAHRGEMVEFLYELGKVYVNKQRDSLALHLYQQALDTTLITPDNLLYPPDRAYWLSMIYNDMASCQLRLGKPDEAMALAQKALHFARKTPVLDGWRLEKTGGAQQTLGDIYAEKNRFPEALEAYGSALSAVDSFYKILYQKKLNRECAKIRLAIARTEHRMGHSEPALRHCQEAIRDVLPEFNWQNVTDQPPLEAFYSENVLLEAQQQKAEIFYSLYLQEPQRAKLEPVTASLERALAAADSLSAFQQYEEARLLALSIEYPATELMLQSLWELHHTWNEASAATRAFAFAERKKASVLRQKKAYEQALRRAAPELATRYYAILEKISNLQTDSKSEPDNKELLSQLAAAKAELVQIKAEVNRLQHGSGDLNALTAANVQENLKNEPGALLLEYFYSPANNCLYGWGIRPDGIRFEKLSYDRTLARQFRENLDNSAYWGEPQAFSQFVRQSKNLYDALVLPLHGHTPATHLIVAPDDALYGIPFDILLPRLPDDTLRRSFATLPYLLRETAVRTTPSATLAFSSPGAASGYARSYLGVAPHYSGYEGWLDSVRFGAACIRRVKDLFQSADTLTGTQATVEGFKKQSPQYDVVHFYGHAGVNTADGQSRMALTHLRHKTAHPAAAPPTASGANLLDFADAPPAFESSILREDELLALSLKARLTVLSACETGVGDYQTGEGIMSLGRSFYYAGCASTVLSLWKLDDEATSGITETFFRKLGRGLPKDEALRQAKLAYLSEQQEKGNTLQLTPNFWAGIQLMGDNTPLLPASRWHWYAALIGVLLLAASWWFRRRR